MLVVLWTALATPGELPAVLAFLALLYRLHPQVQQLDAARVSLAAALAPAAAVMELLAPGDEPVLRSGARRCERLETGITLREVTFRYEAGGPPALDRVSLHIPAGATTAIAGPSGAGKSTLVRLLLRLADPTSGTIQVDGTPLPELDPASWRARIAVVGQDIPLLDATVAENIAYGRPTPASDGEIREAARRADADGFIEALPHGYATRLGADGVRLSGGQRQRIALARALLRDPEVLILDEATNAVDGVSAELIRRTLTEFGRGRTLVVVSHRPATVEGADQIVLLDAGRVRERGRAPELLQGGGLFARLHGLDRPRALGGAGR
jgi:subfamily B ATP-binding cassette protein MsbA